MRHAFRFGYAKLAIEGCLQSKLLKTRSALCPSAAGLLLYPSTVEATGVVQAFLIGRKSARLDDRVIAVVKIIPEACVGEPEGQ